MDGEIIQKIGEMDGVTTKKADRFIEIWEDIKNKGFYYLYLDFDEWDIINVLQRPFRVKYENKAILKDFLEFYIKNAAPFALLIDLEDNKEVINTCKVVLSDQQKKHIT